jgi:dodecin
MSAAISSRPVSRAKKTKGYTQSQQISRRLLHLRPTSFYKQENLMSNHTYKLIELVGSSPESPDAAIHNAIARAAKTLRNMDWFEVTETRGQLADGKVAHFQVKLKVGIRLDD